MDSLERIATALEKIASDPEIEIHAGPPICPHCGQFDPDIEVPANPTMRGKLGNYIVAVTCVHCQKVMYGVIESYSMHASLETVALELESPERKEMFSGKPLVTN
jgi:hypothetical protein